MGWYIHKKVAPGNNATNDEKPIFSEVFYRSEKEFIEQKMRELVRDISLMLFGGFIGFVGCTYLLLASGTFLTVIGILGFLGIAGWITWIVWLYFNTVNTSLTYLVITSDGIKIIVGNRKIKSRIHKDDVKKVVVNLRKKWIEIHLKNGEVIYSKRRDRNWMEHNFVYHSKFEQFKKAMKEIDAEYEIIPF